MDLPAANDLEDDQLLFHAGTRREETKVTAGGRVLACIGMDAELEKAVQKAYGLVDKVKYEGKTFRTDIGSVG